MRERQIPSPTSLTLPNGKLNPDAVGWAASPIIDTSGIGLGRGRNKRWEYWNVVTPKHIIAMTVSSIDYACVPEVWVYDRVTGDTHGRSEVVIPARGSELTPTLEEGPSYANANGMRMRITEQHDPDARFAGNARATRLEARVDDVSFDIFAELPEGHERLALVVPWSDTRFQYTVKDVARPAYGSLTIGGETFDVPSGESWAVLDHGRGFWALERARHRGAGGREVDR